MSRNRRQQAEKNDAYRAQQRHNEAGLIRDRYPDVASVEAVFEYSPEDPGLALGESKAWPPKGPQHSALFEYPCRMRDCAHGGYDLHDAVTAMLAEGIERIEGDAVCPGRIDTRYRCKDRIHYEVSATFSSYDSP